MSRLGLQVWELSALAQVLRRPLPPLSTLQRLYVFEGQRLDPHLEGNTENAECWNYYSRLPP